MNNDNPSVLVWTDVETTGLDAATCALLQVAVIPTDELGTELGQTYEAVIAYSPEEVATMRAECVEFVRDMHDATGLWERLSSPEAKPREQVDRELAEFVGGFVDSSRDAQVAGNSVRLDLNFMDAYLPAFAASVHYRFIDVTGLRTTLQRFGVVDELPNLKSGPEHDAMADIRVALDTYRWLYARTASALDNSRPEPVEGAEHIDVALDKLREAWLRNPAMRLGQVVGQAARQAGWQVLFCPDDDLLANLDLRPHEQVKSLLWHVEDLGGRFIISRGTTSLERVFGTYDEALEEAARLNTADGATISTAQAQCLVERSDMLGEMRRRSRDLVSDIRDHPDFHPEDVHEDIFDKVRRIITNNRKES